MCFAVCQQLLCRLVCSGVCGFWGAHIPRPSQPSVLSPVGPGTQALHLAPYLLETDVLCEEETYFSLDLTTTTKPQSPPAQQPAGLGFAASAQHAALNAKGNRALCQLAS